ncbi:phospholipase D precursor (plasmid) [Sulfuricella denitrificans skB26]|uniref:Phospholipase D n=1 Tax=Sulfuricella denitrificans (strain DSM 22764 / NBRC 105220 / skB26) TaxID=1163617 RepID=S6APL2_SULDS|nr:phospholipase D precursor [Sulfuricella denitrificans skB26]
MRFGRGEIVRQFAQPGGQGLFWRLRTLYLTLLIAATAATTGCSTYRTDVPRPPSFAIGHPEETSLGRAFSEQLGVSPDLSGFHLLVSGQEAFLARAALAESSERTLDLQYYIVAEDASATLLLYRALRAAQRGVRERLLIDDIYAVGRDFDLAALAAHPNVQVRVFNPFTYRGPLGISRLFELLGDSARLNRRMHNKLWIADNAVAVIGGRNLGDAYFNVGTDNDFADLDVLAAGPVVMEMSRSFDEYWNSDLAVPIAAFVGGAPGAGDVDLVLSRMAAHAERFHTTEYARTLRASGIGPLVRAGQFPLVPAYATVYDTHVPALAVADAAKQGRPVAMAIRRLVENAQHETILISPYFIPSARGVDLLCSLVKRGVHVRVLTNSLASTDVPVVHAGYARYRPRLIACGVELHEMRPRAGQSGSVRPGLSSGASLHVKAVVVDGKSVLIGSMNLDPRSRVSNTEIAILIESAALGAQLTSLLEEATAPEEAFRVELTEPGNKNAALVWVGREDGRLVRYDSEPLASVWRRMVAGLLGTLAPEELL